MLKKTSQSGRSMVEMLGVLAIIGVLSIGGIAGYTLSMRKHRANQVVDLMSKFGLLSYVECQKKFLDGSLGRRDYCYRETAFFKDMDLGPLPAGVTEIAIDDIYLTGEGGINEIETYATFSDTKLCQAVASIVGVECVVDMVGYTIITK